jgi:glutamate-1-semialdehyde aminotransferase
MRGWEKLAGEAGLRVEVAGMPGLATFKLDYGEESQAVHTLFTQEMLDRGFLASKNFYTSYSHTDEVVEKYLAAVEEVFRVLAWAVEEGKVREMLRGPVAHAGFKRLT